MRTCHCFLVKYVALEVVNKHTTTYILYSYCESVWRSERRLDASAKSYSHTIKKIDFVIQIMWVDYQNLTIFLIEQIVAKLVSSITCGKFGKWIIFSIMHENLFNFRSRFLCNLLEYCGLTTVCISGERKDKYAFICLFGCSTWSKLISFYNFYIGWESSLSYNVLKYNVFCLG